jgi:hypothetical protein
MSPIDWTGADVKTGDGRCQTATGAPRKKRLVSLTTDPEATRD